jgi:hypothetical protein
VIFFLYYIVLSNLIPNTSLTCFPIYQT